MKKLLLLGALFAFSLLSAQTRDNQLHFDGINDYVNLNAISPSMVALGNTFTIEFWTNFTVPNNGAYNVMFGANSSTAGNRFLIRTAGPLDNAPLGSLVLYFNDGAGNVMTMPGNRVVGDGGCHHIAVVNNANNFSVFIDGTLDITGNFNLNFLLGDRFSLGQEFDPGFNTSQFFNGTMEELRIWNVARTQPQLVASSQANFNFIPFSLVHLFGFNQGQGGGNNTAITALANSANLAANGNLIGFALNGATSNFVVDDCSSDNMLDFDGTDNYVDLNSIANTVNGLGNFTIEFWTRFTAGQNNNFNVMFGANTAGGQNRFLIRTNGPSDNAPAGSIVLFFAGNGASVILPSNRIAGDGNCHHIAVVRTGNNFDLYIDGTLDVSVAYNLNFAASDLFSLGQEFDTGATSQFFNGALDDFRIWSFAKTQAQIISENGSDLIGNEPNLAVYYGFNQGVPNVNNTFITNLDNSAVAAESGILNGFTLNGFTSNFIVDNCVSTPTGNPGDKPKTKFSMSPDEFLIEITYNSSDDILNIQATVGAENAKVAIYDLNGRILYKSKLNLENKQQIDVSSFSRGLFIVNVESGSSYKRQKFVKL